MACVMSCGIATAAPAQAPHATHEARLGGAFATAAGDTLHVEALFSEQRRVRLFVTEASGAPIPLERLRTIEATAVAAGRESPFILLESDGYFEARIATLMLPAAISVRFKTPAAAPDERFDFEFRDYSPAVALDIMSPVEVPGTLQGILGALADERRLAQSIIDRQQFPELLGTEDHIRDLVLAIEPYLERLSAGRRERAQDAITAVVRACWLLHTSLDYGTIAQRDAALAQLNDTLDRTVAAVADLAQ